MSDQALASKAGFGALVLVFCAASYLARKAPEPTPRTAREAVAAPASSAAPAAPPVQQASETAPLDVQDDAPPVRVEVTFRDEGWAAAPRVQARARTHRPAQGARLSGAPAPRIHPVVARRKASPYAIGRKHYPYDPRERWAMRDSP